MCQGRKLRRVICKSCSAPGRSPAIGLCDVFKKGFEFKGGKPRCVVWDCAYEIESKHRFCNCMARTMLGLKSGNGAGKKGWR